MRRYFYNEVGIISKWLEKNALAKLLEDSIYRSAFLSAYKLQPDHNLDDLKEIILNMTIPEQ